MTFCRLILSLSLSLSPVAADTVIAAAAEDLVKLGVDREAAVHLLDSWVAVAGAPPADSLVQAIAGALRFQAPVDLIIDKTSEGLAKQIPPHRLLPALDRWGRELSQACEIAARLHKRFDAGRVSVRETVLRVHLLRRSRADGVWLRRLFASALESEPSVGGFLRASEAVAHLRHLGLSDDEAVSVGQHFLAAGVSAGDMDDLLRVIEVAGEGLPLAEAARQVSERVTEGWTAEEVMTHTGSAVPDGLREREQDTDVGRVADRNNEENDDDND